MSVEFVEPEPVAADPRVDATGAGTGVHAGAWAGRVVGLAAVVSAALVGVAVTQPLYAVRRTAFIVDFDGTTARTVRIPVDAFGDAARVELPVAPVPSGQGSVASSVLTISTPDGISYGRWWMGVAAGLLLVAGWGLVRARSRRPAVFVAVLGALLAGSLGTAWLAIRTVDRTSIPQITFVAEPAAGLWLLVAGAAVAVLAGLLGALQPRLPRRFRRRAGRAPTSHNPDPTAEVREPGAEPG